MTGSPVGASGVGPAGSGGRAGLRLRGHEFHYSVWQRPTGAAAAYRVDPRDGDGSGAPVHEGFAAGSLLASYVHLHFAQDPSLAAAFVSAARAWRAAAALAVRSGPPA